METTTTNQIRQLNQEEEENLKSFREDRKKDRTYIKFEDGETRILKFDTTKRARREPSDVYKDKINYVFSVIEPSVGLDVKTWSVSPTVADQIYTELAKGYTGTENNQKWIGQKYAIHNRRGSMTSFFLPLFFSKNGDYDDNRINWTTT